MTRRDLALLALTSATAPFALLTPWRGLRAIESRSGIDKGTIYVYAWGGGDGQNEIVQGIFAGVK